MRNSLFQMSELRGVKGFFSFDFFLLNIFIYSLCPPAACGYPLLLWVGQNAPMGCSMCFWGKKKSLQVIFYANSLITRTGDHPLKYYLQLQYSSMLLAVFPSMCQIVTEWFHQFLHLDLLMILLRASLTEMWIFNFKLDIASLTDTQVHQTQPV